jgi:hypothetical protein
VLRNYASESTAKAYTEALELFAKAASWFGKDLNAFNKKSYDEKVFHCNNANSCNNFVDIVAACKDLKTVVYDDTKNNGFFDSSAAGLAVTAATLVLLSYQ